MKILIAILLCILFFLVAIGVSLLFDTKNNFYLNFKELESDPDWYWLSNLLPPSAKNIQLKFDIDSNELSVKFFFEESDILFLKERLEKLDMTEISNISNKLEKFDILKNGIDESCFVIYEYNIKKNCSMPIPSPSYLIIDGCNFQGYYCYQR